jgi:hypothetical protein
MVAVRIGVPNQVIEDIRDSLDGPVVAGEGIGEEVMAECFRNQERTLDKRIVSRQVEIVPEQWSLQGGNVHTGAKQNQ